MTQPVDRDPACDRLLVSGSWTSGWLRWTRGARTSASLAKLAGFVGRAGQSTPMPREAWGSEQSQGEWELRASQSFMPSGGGCADLISRRSARPSDETRLTEACELTTRRTPEGAPAPGARQGGRRDRRRRSDTTAVGGRGTGSEGAASPRPVRATWKTGAENGAEEDQDHAERDRGGSHRHPSKIITSGRRGATCRPHGHACQASLPHGPEEHLRPSNDVYERSKVENIRIVLSQTDYPLALSTQWL
jgi:hypothetical protein